MKSSRLNSVLAILLIASLLTFGLIGFAFADTTSYSASLSGSNEVPLNPSASATTTGTVPTGGVESGTAGNVWVTFDDNGANMRYALNATGGQITAAHLHCGATGENGPLVLTLWSAGALMGTAVASSTITQTSITNSSTIAGSDIETADCMRTIGYNITNMIDLARAIAAGDIYADIHTAQYPDGAARGQLMLTNTTGNYGVNGTGALTGTVNDTGSLTGTVNAGGITGTATISDAQLASLLMQLQDSLNQLRALLLVRNANQNGFWDSSGVWHGISWDISTNPSSATVNGNGSQSVTPGASATVGPNGSQSITY